MHWLVGSGVPPHLRAAICNLDAPELAGGMTQAVDDIARRVRRKREDPLSGDWSAEVVRFEPAFGQTDLNQMAAGGRARPRHRTSEEPTVSSAAESAQDRLLTGHDRFEVQNTFELLARQRHREEKGG